jgi:hypothetical protein
MKINLTEKEITYIYWCLDFDTNPELFKKLEAKLKKVVPVKKLVTNWRNKIYR